VIVPHVQKSTAARILRTLSERIREAGYQPHVTPRSRGTISRVGNGRRHDIGSAGGPGVENWSPSLNLFSCSSFIEPERLGVKVRGVAIGGQESWSLPDLARWNPGALLSTAQA